MKLYSTRKISSDVNFEEAIFRGLPSDNGLYMPYEIPKLSATFWNDIEKQSFQDIAFEIAHALIGSEIPEKDLKQIITEAISFDAPLVPIQKDIACLELFHGSSMAFKDFGARFMAATMSYFLEKSKKNINILVATSGDTGGAVAQGFFAKNQIQVIILYPKGKVSDIQEKQLTTLGENVKAIEVDGTFDDCQALVKKAFLDEELRANYHLASANSINISRLIPQTFYYVWAYAQARKYEKELAISVPSGNFGNLTAGLIALKMGMPVAHFVAATNLNKVVPQYLETGKFEPINPSIATISNAMDVGNPSNFPRMLELFGHNLKKMKASVIGMFYNDDQIRKGIKELYYQNNYLACPHTSVAYLGLKDYLADHPEKFGIFLSTAHYAKFLPDMALTLGFEPPIPERLKTLLSLEKVAHPMEPSYRSFLEYLNKILI